MTPRRPLAVVLAAGATIATGCGARAGSDVTSKRFPDAQRQAVSAAVKDLSDSARKGDYGQICSDDLAADLVRRLDAAKGTDRCPNQLELSLRDVGKTQLAVRDVRISGTNAMALVQPTGTGHVEAPARLAFVKEGTRWKLSGVG